MTVADQLVERRDRILERMLEMNQNSASDTPDDQVRQFLMGFYNLVLSSAQGDDQPRNDYLETVIPGIKASGMPLGEVMDGMVRVAMVMGAEVDAEDLGWMVDFNANYTLRLIEIWDQS